MVQFLISNEDMFNKKILNVIKIIDNFNNQSLGLETCVLNSS